MNFEVPVEHGGPGLGVLDTCLMLEELNYGCAGITNAIAANGLAAIPVLEAGTPAQQKRYLGQLTSEPSFAAFCITEPGAGSDAAGISTTYRTVGDEYVLNGTKHFISNGTVASWYVVFATHDKKLRHQGISAFVLPADLPGITQHRMKNKLGQRAADTGEIAFEDVRVPKDALLGREGDGFRLAMRTFDRSRPEIGAIAIGISQRALDECTRTLRAAAVRAGDRSFRRCSSCSRTWRSRSRPCACSRQGGLMLDEARRRPSCRVTPGVRRRPRHAHHDRRRAGFRRLRLHEGVPGREAHAGRQSCRSTRAPAKCRGS
jgi:alkylation response protein AidB-like acyl-CoA dehydrogenase